MGYCSCQEDADYSKDDFLNSNGWETREEKQARISQLARDLCARNEKKRGVNLKASSFGNMPSFDSWSQKWS